MYKFLFRIYQYFRFKYKNFPQSPLSILKELQKREYSERVDTEEYQLKKLNVLIHEAHENTLYYKNNIPSDLTPITSLHEFKDSFPKLTKKEIREKFENLINYSKKNRYAHATSGSTGTPIVTEISAMAQAYRLAGIMRFYSWWGVEPNDRSVLIWGLRKTLKKKNGIISRIKKRFRNRLDINVFDLNEKTIFKYFDAIEQFNPIYLRGYKSALFSLAELMHRNNLEFTKIDLKVIIVTSEVLHEHERKFMEEVFKCRIANEYGAGECGLYAHDCPEGSMHINEESIFITTDSENNSIVTELHNDGMPLINYMNNDRIEISNEFCTCGRTSRLIKKVYGRINDYIICTNGSKKSSHVFNHLMKELNDIGYENSFRFFKVTQSNKDFLLEVVAGDNYTQKASEYYQQRMREEIGEGINITMKLVPEIIRDKSGKLRYFVNNNNK